MPPYAPGPLEAWGIGGLGSEAWAGGEFQANNCSHNYLLGISVPRHSLPLELGAEASAPPWRMAHGIRIRCEHLLCTGLHVSAKTGVPSPGPLHA